jgi:transposase
VTSLSTSSYVPDIEKVRAWIEEKIAARLFVEVVTAIVGLLVRMRDANVELFTKLSDLKRRRPPSEKLARLERQLVLPLFVLVPPTKKRGPKTTERDNHPGRRAFPDYLERVPKKNDVPKELRSCTACGAAMVTVGVMCCETLDVIPARFVVQRRQDEIIECPHDHTRRVADPPPQIVEGGVLTDTLLVEAVCDKYIEHLPLERQCARFARAGIFVASQTLGRGVAATLDLVEPIAKAIEARARGPGLLGTDASAIPVLDPEAPMGIRSGTMWCWTNARWVAFFYSPVGDSDSVKRFLGDDLARTVQCDGTSVTSFLERSGGKRPGCWSHGRRRFVDAARVGDVIACEGLLLIAKLFVVERASALAGDNAEQRRARRQRDTAPILVDLRTWLDDKRGVIPPKTPLGRALGYLHRQWQRLVLFLDDGNIEATNNRRERELRRLVLGRKNWLFTWMDDGATRTARVLSIIASCIAHDVNPRAYLHAVAKLVVHGWPNSRLDELLPDRILKLVPSLYVGDDELLTLHATSALA